MEHLFKFEDLDIYLDLKKGFILKRKDIKYIHINYTKYHPDNLTDQLKLINKMNNIFIILNHYLDDDDGIWFLRYSKEDSNYGINIETTQYNSNDITDLIKENKKIKDLMLISDILD